MHALTFRNTEFDIVDRNGQQWLKVPQIGAALGYADDKAIQRIYARHKDEFTASMTGVVKLTTPSGEQEARIFSLRGAHLLGMFARTAVAKEFRSWVLDILEGIAPAPAPAPRTTKALPNGLSGEQQTSIKALVKARVEALPKDKQAKAAITCWSALKSKFGCTYKAIAGEHYADAIGLVARLPLEGELLHAEQPAQTGLTLTQHEAHHLYLLMARVHTMSKESSNLAAAGLVLKSPVLDTLWEQLVEANRSFTILDARRADLYRNHQALGLSGGYAQPR